MNGKKVSDESRKGVGQFALSSSITGVLEGFDDLAAEEHKENGNRYDAEHGASHEPAPVRHSSGLL
jgi:hypothetical protein